MNFDAFYDILKWVFPPILGLLLFMVRRQDTILRSDVKEKVDMLRSAQETHNAKDERINSEIFGELKALREQVRAWQVESEGRYVKSNELASVEERLRQDIRGVKIDLKELVEALIRNDTSR